MQDISKVNVKYTERTPTTSDFTLVYRKLISGLEL